MNSRLANCFLLFSFVMTCWGSEPALAQWQGLCQNGQWVTLGPGQFQCVPNQVQSAPVQIPQVNLNQQLQNPDNIYNNPINRAIEAVGSMLARNPFQPTVSPDNQPIALNKTVSAALAEMLVSRPPPQPPINYQDPFEPATRTNVSSPASLGTTITSAPVTSAPVDDNLSKIGTMQKQPPPLQSGSSGVWKNSDPYNTHCTGSFKC